MFRVVLKTLLSCNVIFNYTQSYMNMTMYVVLYLWCILNKDQEVAFWFGTRFKAAQFPWVFLLFNLIIGGQFMQGLCGIFVGHIYYFLKYRYTADFGGTSYLETPQFMHKYFPSGSGTRRFTGSSRMGQAAGVGDAPAPRRPGGHTWGTGHRLGD